MGITNIVKFFEGRVGIYADAENAKKLITFLHERGIVAKVLPNREKGGIITEISPKILKNIALALDKNKILVYIIYIKGFRSILSRYKFRYGILVGALIFCLALWASTLFVWKINVQGTDMLSKEQVTVELEKMGVFVGQRKSKINRDNIGHEFLSSHPQFSWAALNFVGTTATLVVKETQKTPTDDTAEKPQLLIAAEDGVISSILAFEGVPMVKVGSVVKKGDVLICGYISGNGLQISDNPALRVGYAVGSVTANVERSANVFLPYAEECVEWTFSEKAELKISVFGKSVSFFKFPEDSLDSDMVSESKNVTFFGFIELPIVLTTTHKKTAQTTKILRDEEEIKQLARQKVTDEVNKNLSQGELLWLDIKLELDEFGCTATASYGCAVDISKPYYLK